MSFQIESISNCFLCGSPSENDLQNYDAKKAVGRGQKHKTAAHSELESPFKFKPCHNILLKLLLNTGHPLYKDLVLLINKRRDKGCSVHFRFCGDCEKTCEDVEELQLQLEVLQMKIVDKLQSVKERVIRNSRVYGSNARVKADLDKFEERLRERELNGVSCDYERQFLEILDRFQTFVFEKDVRELNIPLVVLEKYTEPRREEPTRRSKKVEEEIDLVKAEPLELSYHDDHFDSSLDFSLRKDFPEEGRHTEPEVKIRIDSVSPASPEVPSTSIQLIKGQKRKAKAGRIVKKRKASTIKDSNNSTPRKVIQKEAKLKQIVQPIRTSSRKAASSASQRLKELRKKQVYQIITKIVPPPKRSKPTEAQLLARQIMQARFEAATISNEKMYSSKGTRKPRCCEICPFKHRRLQELESHLKTHEIPEENNYTCPDCKRGFTHKQLFDMHLLQHVGQRKCDVCDVLVKSVNMEEHLKTHCETVFRCHWCDYVFGSFPALIFHTKFHKGKSLTCEMCPSEAQPIIYSHPNLWRGELLEHLYKVHNFTNLLIKCEEENCSKTFWDPKMLRIHMNIHLKRYPCSAEGCDKLFVSQGVANVHYQHVHAKEKSYKCDLCFKNFIYKDLLNNHQIAQHGFPKLKCKLCDMEFNTAKPLSKHKRVVHRLGKNVDQFQCKVCKKVCSSSHTLKDHLVKVHSNRKDFTCEICGFATTTMDLLKHHIKKHDGVKGFQCSYCPKAFTYNQYLEDHLRTHTLERPFQCETCGAAFNQRGSLNLHKKKHLEKGNNFLPKGPRVAKKRKGSTEVGSADGVEDNTSSSCDALTDALSQSQSQ